MYDLDFNFGITNVSDRVRLQESELNSHKYPYSAIANIPYRLTMYSTFATDHGFAHIISHSFAQVRRQSYTFTASAAAKDIDPCVNDLIVSYGVVLKVPALTYQLTPHTDYVEETQTAVRHGRTSLGIR